MATVDDDPHQLTRGIGAEVETLHHIGHQFSADAAQQRSGAARPRPWRARAEITAETSVDQRIVTMGAARDATAVVLAQRQLIGGDGLDAVLRAHRRGATTDVRHQRVHALELAQRRPARVKAAPTRSRRQPEREGLGEIFSRMRLRIPTVEMLDESAAQRIDRIGVGVGRERRAEDLAPSATAAQAIGGIDGVSRLVAQDAHEAGGIATLDDAAHPALQTLEAWMREIEGDGDAGDTVGREPFLREPDMWPQCDATRVEFGVQAADRAAQHRTVGTTQTQVAEPHPQHGRIRLSSPSGPSARHTCLLERVAV